MFKSSAFDKSLGKWNFAEILIFCEIGSMMIHFFVFFSLENATSNLRLEPDWEGILSICDQIRQGDVTPKYAVQSIKKKMFSQNPHQCLFALMVLESVVKNCGSPVHEEISNKTNCETFAMLVNNTPHENVKAKMLELIQTWAIAFKTNFKYRGIRVIFSFS